MIETVYTNKIKPVVDCADWVAAKLCSEFNLSIDGDCIMMASNSCGRTWNCRRPFDTAFLLHVCVAGLDAGCDDSSDALLWIRCRISRVDRV